MVVDQLVENDSFSLEAFDNKLGRAGITNLNEAFRERIKQLYNEDRVKYAESLESTLKSVESFKGVDIKFNQVSVSFLKDFEKHLVEWKINHNGRYIYEKHQNHYKWQW